MTSSSIADQKKEYLEEIFSRLKAAGLKLKLEKCCFFNKHIQYLGHLISAVGIQPLTRKIRKHGDNASSKEPKRSETISWTSRILLKVCAWICRHIKGTNTPQKERCRIQMGSRV